MYTASKEDNITNLKNSQNLRDVADATNEAKNALVDAANKAGKKVRSIVNNASDELVHARDTVTTQIRTNPVQSSLIALGVGVVLGALFRK